MATTNGTISERLQAQQNAYDNMQDQLKERTLPQPTARKGRGQRRSTRRGR